MSQAKQNGDNSFKQRLRFQHDRLGTLLILFSLLSILYLSVELIKRTLYSQEIKKVNVEIKETNLRFTERAELIELMNLNLPFMQQNVSDIGVRLKGIPWISHVEVRKHWPNKITVKIKEYQPVAIWNKYQLLNINAFNFRVLPAKMFLSQDLVALFGPEGTQKAVLEHYYQIKGVVDSTIGLANVPFCISELLLGQNLDWHLKINKNITVLLGREALKQRIERLLELYPLLFKIHGEQIESIDLRYESGAAIRLK